MIQSSSTIIGEITVEYYLSGVGTCYVDIYLYLCIYVIVFALECAKLVVYVNGDHENILSALGKEKIAII